MFIEQFSGHSQALEVVSSTTQNSTPQDKALFEVVWNKLRQHFVILGLLAAIHQHSANAKND